MRALLRRLLIGVLELDLWLVWRALEALSASGEAQESLLVQAPLYFSQWGERRSCRATVREGVSR